jgi:hypothetical protein
MCLTSFLLLLLDSVFDSLLLFFVDRRLHQKAYFSYKQALQSAGPVQAAGRAQPGRVGGVYGGHTVTHYFIKHAAVRSRITSCCCKTRYERPFTYKYAMPYVSCHIMSCL